MLILPRLLCRSSSASASRRRTSRPSRSCRRRRRSKTSYSAATVVVSVRDRGPDPNRRSCRRGMSNPPISVTRTVRSWLGRTCVVNSVSRWERYSPTALRRASPDNSGRSGPSSTRGGRRRFGRQRSPPPHWDWQRPRRSPTAALRWMHQDSMIHLPGDDRAAPTIQPGRCRWLRSWPLSRAAPQTHPQSPVPAPMRLPSRS